MKFVSFRLAATCVATALVLTACGGGGSTASTTSTSTTGSTGSTGQQSPVIASLIKGTAATGAAMANAPVTITNSAGASPCVEASITTDALGSYTCTLKAGETAPFFIVVTDPTGNNGALVSIATTTPAAGTPLTVNATPLTTAIVAQLSSDGNALSVVSGKTVDAAALATITANVVAQLSQVLSSIGAPSDYNPFTTSITAATAGNTGNTADMVLDIVKVVTDPATGQLALTTVDNPTPIALATATTSGGTLPQPDAAVSSLSQAAQLVAQKMTSCFALATADRVLSKDTTVPQSQGGPEVTDVGAACQDFVSDATNGGGMDFIHNGYYAGQIFYGMLTSDRMTGAQFSVPEIVAFYPKSATAVAPALDAYDRAIVNIRYIDNVGNPGNTITVAARIPGSSTTARPTEWWLVGNQQTVDVSVRLNLRRVEQMNPANTGKFSTFQTGAVFNINVKGPGSTSAGSPLTLARVTGPGLPTGGLVYKVSNNAGLPNMDLWNKTGSLTAGNQCGGGGLSNCPNVWFSRTAGLTGSAATTLATNPPGLIWAQPADGYDPTRFVKGARYQVELFYGSNTGTPDLVVNKTLVTDLVPATLAVNLPWNTPGSATLAALDPNGALAGAQTALPVDWVQNPAAPQIGSALASVDTLGSFGVGKGVALGATSMTYDIATVPPSPHPPGSARSSWLTGRRTAATDRPSTRTTDACHLPFGAPLAWPAGLFRFGSVLYHVVTNPEQGRPRGWCPGDQMLQTNLPEFSRLLLTLYRHAQELPVHEFQDAVLHALKPTLPFDASTWGTATMTPVGVDIHSLHRHNFDDEMFAAFDRVKHQDSAAVRVTSQPRMTIGFSAEEEFTREDQAEIRQFARDYSQHHCLITSDIHPLTRFAQWVSLFRSDPEHRCTDGEIAFLDALAPHLMQSLAINRLVHLDRLVGDVARESWAVAIADPRGVLYHADPRFKELMECEWPLQGRRPPACGAAGTTERRRRARARQPGGGAADPGAGPVLPEGARAPAGRQPESLANSWWPNCWPAA
jgi:hypothetical protein